MGRGHWKYTPTKFSDTHTTENLYILLKFLPNNNYACCRILHISIVRISNSIHATYPNYNKFIRWCEMYSFSVMNKTLKFVFSLHGKGALEVYPNKIFRYAHYRKSVLFVKVLAK